MNREEYLAVRRAYNLVRREVPVASRITFEEMALLAHLKLSGAALPTSRLADHQGVLRPTMTHRTNHLDSIGLISRSEGTVDRRNVNCSLSAAGSEELDSLLERSCRNASKGKALTRIRPERMLAYADAMGTLSMGAGELVLLALAEKGSLSVSGLVDALGILQPTASMAVMRLEEEGLVVRDSTSSARSILVSLTDAGTEAVQALSEQIEGIVVHRSRKA